MYWQGTRKIILMNTNFKSILRNLWKNRVVSLINVLGLTFGLTSLILLFIFLRYENSFDTHQPKADQIYRVNYTVQYPNRLQKEGNTASMLKSAMVNEFSDLEAVFQVIGPRSALMKVDPGKPTQRIFEEKRNVFFADSLFLKYMDYDFIAGNPRTALDGINGIVLSSQLVDKFYPNYQGQEHELLGLEIELYEEFRAIITGVIDSPPSNSNFPFKALVSSEIYYKQNEWDRDNWGNIGQGITFAVLHEDQDPSSVENRFPDLVKKYMKDEEADRINYSLLNLKELHTSSIWGFTGNYTTPKAMVIGFVAVGLFILASACINFVNLQTAQAINRAKEVSIRKVMGSSRLQLVAQFLVETAILASISFLFALWCAELMLDAWNSMLSIVQMNMQLDLSVILAGTLMILIVTLLAGIYPAWTLSSFKPTEALRGNVNPTSSKRKKSINLRSALVVIQFVISQILLIGTIVIASQINYFIEKDVGYRQENMFHVSTFDPNENQLTRLTNGIESMPEITNYSLSSGPPISGGRFGTTFTEPGQEDKGRIKAQNMFVDHRYLENFELELVAGRNFRVDEIGDSIRSFIVNETLVNQLEVAGIQGALGKNINCYGVRAPIVGVLKDFNSESLDKKIAPLILMPSKSNMHTANVQISAGETSKALSKLESLWLEVFPSRSFAYLTAEKYLMQAIIVEDLMFKSIRLFSGIAIFIGCLGLYGLVSFMAIKKTKEIGIRKVLGASYAQILTIFSSRFFILVFIAFVIAAPVAYQAMELWLSNYVYRVSLGWTVFAFSFLGTLVFTALTVSFISLRAARRNPAETLKFE